MELIIQASVGGRNVRRITLPILLLLSSPFFFFFFFTAAAHLPSTAITADLAHYQTNSVLKLPTDADNTALKRGEACCGKCGTCLPTWPAPLCTCSDVLENCPSWCFFCVPAEEGGYKCMDTKPDYCKDNCRKNGRCCNKCGPCTKSIPPVCSCADVTTECPSWCTKCDELDDGFVCMDQVANYCDQNCAY